MPDRVRVIDSHTEGEPTRLILDIPELLGNTLAEKASDFKANHAELATGTLLEPRGSDVWVGALLMPPTKSEATAAVIFYNNVGTLGMCGHGTMGLVASLAYMGRIKTGDHMIETPVGDVIARLSSDGSVSVKNVVSYRTHAGVSVAVPGRGAFIGDISYGGNWFFLVKEIGISIAPSNIDDLMFLAEKIKHNVNLRAGRSEGEPYIDHVELFGPPERPDADSKNFVLCPGNAYDRSPCGTGTSAKLACLAADGKLAPGEIWRQESIIGTKFEASYEHASGGILPTITGRAFVTGESTLIFNKNDPFRAGIRFERA